jgi:hypothetical protein
MLLQSLLKTANVSASTVSSLEKKALLEVYVEAIRRDPLSETRHHRRRTHVSLPDKHPFSTDRTTDELGCIFSFSAARRNRQRQDRNLHARDEQGAQSRSLGDDARAGDRTDAGFLTTPARSLWRSSRDLSLVASERGERFDEWTRVRNGEARVVIGTGPRCSPQ